MNTGKPYGHRAPLPSPSAFQSFTTGSLDRDFEGVGGWHDLSAAAHYRRSRTSRSSSSSSSNNNALCDEDTDDKVWLSMNQRLELPSLSRRRSSGSSGRRRFASMAVPGGAAKPAGGTAEK